MSNEPIVMRSKSNDFTTKVLPEFIQDYLEAGWVIDRIEAHREVGGMMSDRVEAAAKANYEDVTGTPWVSAPKLTAKLCRKAAATIIAAADAVMFSDEAVERLARQLGLMRYSDGDCTVRKTADGTDLDLHRARLLIAALKGDDA